MNKKEKGNVISALALLLSSCTAFVSDGESEMKLQNAWSQSGDLITFSQNAGVTMQKTFPRPGNYTVQFGFITGPGVITRPRALISWNVEGNQIEREVSPANGTSVSGQAQGVTVNLFDDSRTGMPGTPGQRYVGLINVTRGLRAFPGQQAPIFMPSQIENPVGTIVNLGQTIVVAAGTTAAINIPKGATQVWVYAIDATTVAPPAAGTFIVRQVEASGAFIYGSYYPNPPFWAQLIPAAEQIRLVSLGANNVNCQILFGIDG